MTKAVNQDLIDRHMMNLNIRWESGRAVSAPTLDGFSLQDQARLSGAGQSEPNAVEDGARLSSAGPQSVAP